MSGPISQQRTADGRYWNPEIETAPPEKLRHIQAQKLRHIVQHSYENSRFYRRKLDDAGLKPQDIQTIEDLPKLPVTTKEELRDSQTREPMWGDILAVPVEQCVTVHFTSATTGLPVAMLDTWDDWHNGFVESYARGIYAMGVRPKDVVLPAFAYGPYIGFWSAHVAMERIGCLVMPGGGASTEQRINYMRTYPITVLCCTPSYALFLAEQAQKMGIDVRKDAKIRLTFHTGEPGGQIPSVKRKIEEALGCKTYDIAGLTEIAAWGFECEPQPGGDHIHDDYVLSEVLDLDTGKPVGPGEQGELILTNLYRHAIPLLRWRRDRPAGRYEEGPRRRGLPLQDRSVRAVLQRSRRVPGALPPQRGAGRDHGQDRAPARRLRRIRGQDGRAAADCRRHPLRGGSPWNGLPTAMGSQGSPVQRRANRGAVLAR